MMTFFRFLITLKFLRGLSRMQPLYSPHSSVLLVSLLETWI
uniref:Uncharacterized protein n=1 Tax=Arundo donax TaxID=35708 RepID=A0A0A9GEK9_ARUDO